MSRRFILSARSASPKSETNQRGGVCSLEGGAAEDVVSNYLVLVKDPAPEEVIALVGEERRRPLKGSSAKGIAHSKRR